LKKEYQHSVGLTVELDKVLLIIGSLSFVGKKSGKDTYKEEDVRATLRGLKKEYQHSLGLTVELDKVLLIIGSHSFVETRTSGKGTHDQPLIMD
jgi:hypothetical protein